MLLADDMGYGDLGVSGHPTSQTPNLDKLAKSSLHLTSFYVSSAVCSPSRASILTGKILLLLSPLPNMTSEILSLHTVLG